jgi:hypothetical protein
MHACTHQTEELRQVRAARDVDAAKLEAAAGQVGELQRSEARLREQVQQLSTASASRVGGARAFTGMAPCVGSWGAPEQVSGAIEDSCCA